MTEFQNGILAGGGGNYYDASAFSAAIPNPQGLALSSSLRTVFYAETSSHRVRAFDLKNQTVSTIAGTLEIFGSFADGPALSSHFNAPAGIAFDQKRNAIFVGDLLNNRIRFINLTSNYVSTVAGTGEFNFLDGPALSAKLKWPADLCIHNEDFVYFADSLNYRIRKLDIVQGVVTTVVGNGNAGFEDNVPALNASMNVPVSVVFDSAGNLFFTDSNNNRVRKLNIQTGIVSTFAGNGTQGFADGSNAMFNIPYVCFFFSFLQTTK